MKKGKRNWVRR